MAASLAYHEPGIEDILILSTFLLALNLINSVLNRTLYCGLVGQLLIGVAWGTPGAKWLSPSLEEAIVQLGYLGLIMIVFEGGLSTSIATMKANLLLSACVAVTGIAAPMALSFFLAPVVGASHVQCFAAGAALCSTSLGTTFTVLSTSGLVSTPLGSVLSTAAMMDDVVGLVMVQIVASLGGGSTEISPVIVIRPILVSLAFAVLVPLACRFMLKPAMAILGRYKGQHKESKAVRISRTKQTVFVMQTVLLLALIVGASYAGASVLLAAYLAGIIGAWCDEKALKIVSAAESAATPAEGGSDSTETISTNTEQREMGSSSSDAGVEISSKTGRTPTSEMYELYYAQAVQRVLSPLFFASIGFSIPISKMFTGSIVWRGIIYTILMLIGKALCGLWLVRFSPPLTQIVVDVCSSVTPGVRSLLRRLPFGQLIHKSHKEQEKPDTEGSQPQVPPLQETQTTVAPDSTSPGTMKTPARPLTLYPAGILSFAMVARGEIGFLISSVAESNGVFRGSSSSASPDGASEIFLIITWAIVLCTVIGPFSVGLLVRRVKKLEAGSSAAQVEGKKDVLGAWGVA